MNRSLSFPLNQFRLLGVLCLFVAFTSQAAPIRLHPENPRWFEWQGKATALITSAEHYGAVINLDFDYHTYLAALERDGMNYTRIFAGSYVEPLGAFNIANNTLGPAEGRFLAPWVRSDEPGYAAGGNKFDLDQHSPIYLARLQDFLTTAARYNVIVELTFFTSTYSDKQWDVHPFNPVNRIQSFEVTDWKNLHTTANGPDVRAIQEKLVRWLVRELNDHDNLIFEIQNEPWSDNHTMGESMNPYQRGEAKWPHAVELTKPESIAWQQKIAQIITDEESSLPKTHLIAQNVANFRHAVNQDDLVPEASIINFHYAYPEAVTWNRGWNRVIGYDESGFAGRKDITYRRQAWNFIMSGGGLFNSLDYSFYVGSEDGLTTTNEAPGGGSLALRQQLKVLSDFLHHFELSKLNPDGDAVAFAPGVVTRTLSHPGAQYLTYLEGRGPTTLHYALPSGHWQIEWIDTMTGEVIRSETAVVNAETTPFPSPEFSGEIAVRIFR